MKFVSKNTNLRVVLRHGTPAEPITGRQSVPGLYVKFENGSATVNDEEMCVLMLAHPGFDSDFIKVDEDSMQDPFARNRRGNEPEHDIQEMKYGHVERSLNPKPQIAMNQDTKNAIMDMATEMAKKMAPQIAMEMLKTMVANNKREEVISENDPVPMAEMSQDEETPKKKNTKKK